MRSSPAIFRQGAIAGESVLADSVLLGATTADWIALLKPRVMVLVVFTGIVGLLLAPGGINPVLGFAAILCIAVAAGAAGAINMWYDRDIDAIIPVPSVLTSVSELDSQVALPLKSHFSKSLNIGP